MAQVAASATCVPTAQEVAGNVALDSSTSSGFATPVGSKLPTGATQRHNGIVVHNNLELENKTGGGSVEGPNPLPILFQNHGNAVHFRNVWLIDKDAAPSQSAPCSATSPLVASVDCSGGTIPTCCVSQVKCRPARMRRGR